VNKRCLQGRLENAAKEIKKAKSMWVRETKK
jgi:hypothetical protein